MIVRISRSLLDRLHAEAASSLDREICGLMLGTKHEIAEIVPAENVSDDPERRFEIDPAAIFAQLRAERAGGLQRIGHYHSHPNGHGQPSACDAEAAADAPDQLWLILTDRAATLWRSGDPAGLHGCFTELALEVVPACAVA